MQRRTLRVTRAVVELGADIPDTHGGYGHAARWARNATAVSPLGVGASHRIPIVVKVAGWMADVAGILE
jgi:hypothetical protein